VYRAPIISLIINYAV